MNFIPLADDPVKTTIKRESRVTTFLHNFKKANVIFNEQFKKSALTGSQPGILYSLPKIRKLGVPL